MRCDEFPGPEEEDVEFVDFLKCEKNESCLG